MSHSPNSFVSGKARYSLSRTHHLKRKSLIEPLFDRTDRSAYSVSTGAVRIVFRFVDRAASDPIFQIGVAVGKSTGNAVRRNRIKRIIWESIRHNQQVLIEANSRSDTLLTAMVLFRGKSAEHLSTDVQSTLVKLKNKACAGPIAITDESG